MRFLFSQFLVIEPKALTDAPRHDYY